MSQMSEPSKPAAGNGGRWVRLGETSVDSAALAVVDPGMVQGPSTMPRKGISAPSDGGGVQFWAGLGDGIYEVYGWVVDYGPGIGERIAQVVVTLVDDEALREWHEFSK